MIIENTKKCAAGSEDYNIPLNIICLPNTSYARDLQAQGACALRFFCFEKPFQYKTPCIRAILPSHELVILTKFYNDWVKNVDFFSNSIFMD